MATIHSGCMRGALDARTAHDTTRRHYSLTWHDRTAERTQSSNHIFTWEKNLRYFVKSTDAWSSSVSQVRSFHLMLWRAAYFHWEFYRVLGCVYILTLAQFRLPTCMYQSSSRMKIDLMAKHSGASYDDEVRRRHHQMGKVSLTSHLEPGPTLNRRTPARSHLYHLRTF